jgi:hypothetical protein
MPLYQLLLVACVAEVAAEVVHMLWVIARGDRLILSKSSSGTSRESTTNLVKTIDVSGLPPFC